MLVDDFVTRSFWVLGYLASCFIVYFCRFKSAESNYSNIAVASMGHGGNSPLPRFQCSPPPRWVLPLITAVAYIWQLPFKIITSTSIMPVSLTTVTSHIMQIRLVRSMYSSRFILLYTLLIH